MGFWKNMKVLITGAEGFIGSHLTEEIIKKGAYVRAFIHYNPFNNWGWLDTLPEKIKSKIEIFSGDIREAYNVYRAMEGIDVVFHLAALVGIPYSYYSPESYVATNIMGTVNVLQAARDKKIYKIVHTSTSETYGSALYVPIDEQHPLQGQSPYSASKIGADMMAKSFYCSFKLPVAICRPFNVYGPRQSARAVIPTIIIQLLSGKKIIELGSLTPTRDFTYVLDTVNGFIKIAESDTTIGEVINIGSGYEISIGDVANKIAQILNLKAKMVSKKQRKRPAKSEVDRLLADNSKAKKLIGWSPKIDLETGLRMTIKWFKNNIKYYKPDIYNI